MKIKELPNSEIEIKLNIPWEKWKKYYDKAIQKLSQELKVEGFRPGKIPAKIVEQKVGKESILHQAAEEAIQENYAEIITKEKIEAIGAPRVELLKLAEGNDLEYKITTAVMPQVELGKWEEKIKKINQKNKPKKIKIADKALEQELEKLAKSRVKLVTVNREARKGDNVQIDFDVLQKGVIIENGSSKNHNLILGNGVFIPGFEENIIGMKAGEEKEFNLKFPENYHAKHLAGKESQFQVKMKAVQKREVPKIDDEFARSLGKFKNLQELKNSLKEGMEKEEENKIKNTHREKIIETITNEMQVTIPKILLDEELHKMMHEFEAQLQQTGMNLDDYLKQINKTKEDLQKGWKPQAEKRIKAALALEKLAKVKEIKVPSEEIEEEMNKTLQRYGGVKNIEKNVDMRRLYEYIKATLQNEKVLQWLEEMK